MLSHVKPFGKDSTSSTHTTTTTTIIIFFSFIQFQLLFAKKKTISYRKIYACCVEHSSSLWRYFDVVATKILLYLYSFSCCYLTGIIFRIVALEILDQQIIIIFNSLILLVYSLVLQFNKINHQLFFSFMNKRIFQLTSFEHENKMMRIIIVIKLR